MNTATFVEGLLREFRHAVRMMHRNRGFSATVVLTLALGIGATTAIFSVVNGVLIKPLPFPKSEAIVTVSHSVVFGNVRGEGFPFSPQMLETYSANGRAFEEMGLVGTGQAAVTGIGDPELVRKLLVTAGTLRALAVQPALGRWISNADDQPGAAETVVLSDGYWRRRFGGDPSAVGRVITLDGRPREVIGVMPPSFASIGVPMDLMLPAQINFAAPPADFRYNAVARLKPGITVADANDDIARMLPIYLERYAGHRMDALQLQPAVHPFKETIVGNVGQVLWVLLGSISILLLIACANVANLLLVRTETRGTEIAVRAALGAGAARLARGLMVESLALSVLGGLVGVGIAYGGLQVLLAFAPMNLPRLREITIDVPVVAFAVAVSILSGLVFGLVPMLKLARRRFSSNLADFVQGGGRWASAGKSHHRSQNTLVVIQVALTLVMLVSSGLMIRTFQNLRSVEPGFTDPASIEMVRVTMSDSMSAEPERVVRIQQQIRERLAAIPGVTSAAYIDQIAQGGNGVLVTPEDRNYGPGELAPTRRIHWISPGLLRTLGTPLLAGRDLEWAELDSQRNVALVSESFARQTWNSVEGALGKRIRVGTDGPSQEVIGVVADIYDDGADQKAPPTVYWPAREHPFVVGNYVPVSVGFALRSERSGTETFLRDIRLALAEVAPDLPIAQTQTLADIFAASMARASFSLVLLAIAGTMSLLISLVGIYGVLAYAVMQRRREVGVRLALGAAPGTVQRMFVYRGMLLSAVGIALGTVVAAALTRLMSSLLFGVAPGDVVTFATAAGFLGMAALLATYIPARRAAAVDPAETLRQ